MHATAGAPCARCMAWVRAPNDRDRQVPIIFLLSKFLALHALQVSCSPRFLVRDAIMRDGCREAVLSIITGGD